MVTPQAFADALAGGMCHIVAVRQAEVIIKALPRGQEFGLIAEMPFTNACGGVAGLFQDLGNRNFIRVQPIR